MARVVTKTNGGKAYIAVVHDYKQAGRWRQLTIGCGAASDLNRAKAEFLAVAMDRYIAGPHNVDPDAFDLIAAEHVGADVLSRLEAAGLAPGATV